MWWKVLHALAYIIRLSFRITFWLGLIPFRVTRYLTDCALWLGGQFRDRILHVPGRVEKYVIILIAGIALVFTISQSMQQRTHDRLSVKPILQIGRYFAQIPDRPQLGLFLKNEGAGIAVIDKFAIGVIEVEDKENIISGQWGMLEAVARAIYAEYPDFPPIQYHLSIKEALAPNTEIALLTVDASLLTPDWRLVLWDYVSRIVIHIEYRSLYNEPFVRDSKHPIPPLDLSSTE